jgi:hypothetical protein
MFPASLSQMTETTFALFLFQLKAFLMDYRNYIFISLSAFSFTFIVQEKHCSPGLLPQIP